MSESSIKIMLLASLVLLLVSTGFMMFSGQSRADAADWGVILKCQACGEVKSYDLVTYTDLAQKQFNELQSSDPGLADGILEDIAKVSVRDDITENTMPALTNKMLEEKLFIY